MLKPRVHQYGRWSAQRSDKYCVLLIFVVGGPQSMASASENRGTLKENRL